ncbi:MAG TPA: V4R domain-containing protein [Chloroflexia bacterium]|nr:V4R domain-containing protein [Chloroflexia bacterium]
MAEYLSFVAHHWGGYAVSEDATAWYLEPPDCSECPGIQGAKAPICSGVTVIIKELAQQIIGRHIRVEEVACQAVDAPHCKRAIYK